MIRYSEKRERCAAVRADRLVVSQEEGAGAALYVSK